MFKSVQMFRLAADWIAPDYSELAIAFNAKPFQPCSPTSDFSAGWVPPRGEDFAECLENINGQWIAKLKVETKSVPSSAIAEELKRLIRKVEQETGRKPGKKEKQDLREEAKTNLLPRAFSRKGEVTLWIDPENRWLVLDSTSSSIADVVIDEVVEAMRSANSLLKVAPLFTKTSPGTAMGMWLAEFQAPHNFTIDQDVELKSVAGDKAAVKYTSHNLDLEEVANHVKQGKAATQLALTWDDRLSFILTDKLTLKKLKTVQTVFKAREDGTDFDSDVTLITSEIQGLLPDLILALDGEEDFSSAVDAPAAKESASNADISSFDSLEDSL